MIIDARSLESNVLLEHEICVIGGGPAGITLALELGARGHQVCVLESGGLEYEDDTQELARGTISGDRYPDPDISRLRILGGSTNHWAGNCSPLDPIDFEKRLWLPHSGWPFSRAVFDSYYRSAQKFGIC